MSQDGPSRRLLLYVVPAFLVLIGWVLFQQLGVSGLLGPDEPRYASIGRAMHESGDWITPRLNGTPWFEKPPLLYWLVAVGFSLGLNPDFAPRAPVAALSLFGLALWSWIAWRLEDSRIAFTSLAILSTTAGWAALSMVAVTDMPLAVSFSLSLALGVLAIESDSRAVLLASGVFLGLAILAKGLVPLVLLLPFFFWSHSKWRQWPLLLISAGLIAAPWYLLMYARHGWAFVDVFFLQHHFGRFSSEALQHVRPIWFYVPVLLAGLFPWTPLLFFVNWQTISDEKSRPWLWTTVFGLLFFSLSTNKLPAYLLPLFPACSLLLARVFHRRIVSNRALAMAMFLLSLAPAIASLLPDALLHGLSRARLGEVHLEYFAAGLLCALIVHLITRRGWRTAAIAAVAATSALCLLFVKLSAAPVLGEIVSAKGLARRISRNADQLCVESLHRNYRYGLDYYLKRELPLCEDAPGSRFKVAQEPGRLPQVGPR